MKKTLNPMLLAAVASFAQAAESVPPLPGDATVSAGWYASDQEKEGMPGTAPAFKLDLRDDYIARVDLDVSHLDEAFDADHVTLPAELLPQVGRFQPMIQEGETGFVPSQHFTKMAKTLATMNKLAYARGQDYRFGHELTYQDTLAGWTLKNLNGKRGKVFTDPNAGFVAHNKAKRTIAIVLHGSINTADWMTNFDAFKVRLDRVDDLSKVRETAKGVARTPEEAQAVDAKILVQKVRLPFPGHAHRGFLEKYESFQEQVMATIDELLSPDNMTNEEKLDTKFYVSGHSQGAALSQFLTLHLCHHLRKHYGPDFINARDNRVHAWLLASPTGMDPIAVAYAEGHIGKGNIVVQNTWLDIVPNVGYSADLVHFKALGTPVMQSSLVAAQRNVKAHSQAVVAHASNGDIKEALRGLLPANMVSAFISAMHMATDNVNYRGVGHSYAFDPGMVDQTLLDLKAGLQMAYDQQQERLRENASRRAVKTAPEVPASSAWGSLKAWFN